MPSGAADASVSVIRSFSGSPGRTWALPSADAYPGRLDPPSLGSGGQPAARNGGPSEAPPVRVLAAAGPDAQVGAGRIGLKGKGTGDQGHELAQTRVSGNDPLDARGQIVSPFLFGRKDEPFDLGYRDVVGPVDLGVMSGEEDGRERADGAQDRESSDQALVPSRQCGEGVRVPPALGRSVRWAWRVELLLEPAVELFRIGEDAGLGRSVQAVDGKSVVTLPKLTGPDVAAKVGGDLLPRFENSTLFHPPSFSFDYADLRALYRVLDDCPAKSSPAQARSAWSFPRTSSTAGAGSEPGSARRARQSKLSAWSARMEPWTGRPAGRGTSKG